MRTSRFIPVLVCALGLAGCSQDVPAGDPGGQGAGRPEAEGSEEAPAQEVLGNTGHPEHQDSTAAGQPGMTGSLRNQGVNQGEAIPGVDQPQPDRPGNPQ